MSRLSLVLVAAVLTGTATVHAQPAVPDSAKLKPIAIPASPAFTFLSASPGEIARPTTARALSVSLLNDLVATGNVPQGLAIDVAPWSFIPGLRISGEAYQTRPLMYALANTQLSIGSVQAAGDSADTDLSTGIRITLFDRGDPLTNEEFRTTIAQRLITACLPSQPGMAPPPARDAAPAPAPPAKTEASIKASEQCASDATERARREWYKDHWNAPSLAIAGAAGWQFAQSRADDADWLGWATWATGSLPLGNSGQILGQLKYANRSEGTGVGYGARAYFGNALTNAFVEISRDESVETPATDWAGGLEFRVPGGFWLSTGFGTNQPPGGGERTIAIIADLRLDLRDAPIFGLRP